MKKEAEERMKGLEELAEEKKRSEQLKVEKKKELRMIQDEDALAKRQFRDRNSTLINNTNDFGDNNVLDYVYKKKEHQSLKLGKKNEYLVNLMKNQFMNPHHKLDKHESATLIRDRDAAFKSFDIKAEEKMKNKKQKEMETKLFQD